MIYTLLVSALIQILISTAVFGTTAPKDLVTENSKHGFCSFLNTFSVEHTFQPDESIGKDAYISSIAPSQNFGSEIDLSVAYYYAPIQMQFESLIEFSELNDSLYQGSTVISAELWLYKYMGNSGGSFYMNVLDSPWEETTVTWNNRPSFEGWQELNGPGSSGWFSCDVTGFVQNWLNGSKENNGFLLRHAGGNFQYTFYSSDYATVPEYRPKLILNYVPFTALERDTWSAIKTSF